MARSKGSSVENNFVNGFVTEATGLNFPENAVTESENCVFTQIGRVERRLGIDAEAGFSYIPSTTANCAFVEYLWESPAGEGQINIHVQQVGDTIKFFRVSDSGSLSSGYITEFVLGPYTPGGTATIADKPCQFDSGFGRLFITHPAIQPLYVTFDPVTNGITPHVITIQIRDSEGTGAAPYGRSAGTDNTRRYNLYNQGWAVANQGLFSAQTGNWPGDYDVWYLFKDSTETFSPLSMGSKIDRGNSPAPKGAVILNAFYQDRRASVPGVYSPDLTLVTSNFNMPSVVAFFAGRVFFSGVNYDKFHNKIYFSQIVRSVEDFAKCYQNNDPTSEYASDLTASDGGVISIADAGTIYKLWSIESALLVFASNGVWQISGSSGLGFTANDYTVKKISTVGALSSLSFVDMGGFPAWWTNDGIYTLSLNSSIGQTQIQSLSEKKIKSYFEDLSPAAKAYAKGSFNFTDKIAQWLFVESVPSTVTQKFSYDHILNYNVVTGAFSIWRVSREPCDIKGIVSTKGWGAVDTTEVVTNSAGSDVFESGGDDVTVSITTTTVLPSVFKYVIATGTSREYITFADERDTDLEDWASLVAGPVNYDSYFVSGYKLRGEGQRKFQTNYLTLWTDNELPSKFYIKGLWDFATSSTTSRWTTRQLVEQVAASYAYRPKRLKIRGHGKALQIRVDSIDNEPFHIIGWAATESVNATL